MSFSINFIWSLLGGMVPALLWLWFWLKEDRTHPEPKRRIFLSFLGGMLAVLLVIPIEQILYDILGNSINTFTLFSWAASEEILKFSAAFLFAFWRNRYNDEPIDSVIYLISVALGFSALENAFFLTNHINQGLFTQSIISGNMRFLGASLLHVSSSATIGIFMALGFYKNRNRKKNFLLVGLILAIILHTLFNSLIIKAGGNLFFVFGGVWLGIILLLLVFEKVKTVRN